MSADTQISTPGATAAARPADPAFVALMAFLFATVAFSIDSMLPALGTIAAELVPQDVNRAQLVLTMFMVGMGIGTLFTGPISDAIGRKPTIIGGLAIYAAGSVMAALAQTIEMLLLARLIQGIGAASPRITVLAMVRDRYQGREMARIMSFVSMLFMVIPAVAPSIGAIIIAFSSWRGIFAGLVAVAAIAALWLGFGQAETLPPERRRPLRPAPLLAAAREAASSRDVRLCTLTVALGFAQMFLMVSTGPQVFADVYAQDHFPLWFAGLAVIAALGTVLNARLVMRVGMWRMASTAYALQVGASLVMLLLLLTGILPRLGEFAAFYLWAGGIFTMAGVTFGNLNSMALNGLGHIAGMTASLVSAVSTVLAMAIAGPIGQSYNGSAVPVVAAALVCSGLAWVLMRGISRVGP